MRFLPWLVAIGTAGVAMYLIDSGKLDNDENQFLGFIDLSQGFGLDDVARGGTVVGLSVGMGMLVHKLTGGAVPQGTKV